MSTLNGMEIMSAYNHIFGLIGYPLGHSFSRAYFNEKFRSLGLNDHVYLNFPIENIMMLRDVINQHPNLKGLNVTIPYKEQVMTLLDEIDPQAASVGAVNCVAVRNGRLFGYNTDIYGFKMSIRPFLENHYERALILGTGGAAKAVAFVLREWGVPYYLVSRNPVNGAISYRDLNADSIGHFKLIINATPTGMAPHTGEAPSLPYEAMGSGHFLYDLIYNPEETKFMQLGAASGAKTMNGMAMLRLQAEKSWEIWKSVG
jgi:shikimate dehydrogenase